MTDIYQRLIMYQALKSVTKDREKLFNKIFVEDKNYGHVEDSKEEKTVKEKTATASFNI